MPEPGNQIRNISQTAQEREIVKTAPDIVVYIEGSPYLKNPFINDRRTGKAPTIVNFNDHVTGFTCSYDTDLMIPSGTIALQVPNHQKYLYQMPGGNNLIEPMMQIQVYAKAYYMSSKGDTIYRRVFKGLVSHVGYNDNGKTFEISLQCYGMLYMLELMKINLSPSLNTAAQTGSAPTFYSTKFAMSNPYQQIAIAFTQGLGVDSFNLNNLTQSAVNYGRFGRAVQQGYINKWQAILSNLSKDIHIFGVSWKDDAEASKSKESDETKSADQDMASQAGKTHSTKSESDMVEQDMYYGQIRQFLPERQIADVSLLNNQIVSRMELIRKMVRMIDFEAYQDIDGKIIVKPPLYNLDVMNLGTRTKQTSTTAQSRFNSYSNPLTAIYPNNNPFVVYLAEILTEQESEDQAAIKRTRTVVSGNVDVKFQFGYNEEYLHTSEYIDVGKLIKFGLREEPVIYTPWIKDGTTSLFAHAVAETVRANRGYRTYTFTIPLRPELKLGFPVFIPHRDMYAYIKSISISYQVGATATMTVTCDSVRRRFLVNTTQKDATGQEIELFTSAPNMVLKWTKSPTTSPTPPPGQSKIADNTYVQEHNAGVIAGGNQPSSQQLNLTKLTGVAVTIPSAKIEPSDPQKKVQGRKEDQLKTAITMKTDTTDPVLAQYFIQNDGDQASGTIPAQPRGRSFLSSIDSLAGVQGASSFGGYYTQQRPVDKTYIQDIRDGVIPYSDEKGYELLAPFPWGRWIDLNTAIKQFTEDGWVNGLQDANGNQITDPQEEIILKNTDAFLYAGLGTPTATGSAADQLQDKFAQISNTIGGAFTPSDSSKPNELSLDATVIVLQYQPGSSNDDQLLKTDQPENAIAQKQILDTQNTRQRLVDVLVSGSVAPTKLTLEALKSTQNQDPLNTQSLGSTPNQQAQQAKQFASTPPSDQDK